MMNFNTSFKDSEFSILKILSSVLTISCTRKPTVPNFLDKSLAIDLI